MGAVTGVRVYLYFFLKKECCFRVRDRVRVRVRVRLRVREI